MEIPALSVPIVHIAITITVTCEDTQFRVVETGFLPWTLTTGGRVPDIESGKRRVLLRFMKEGS